MTPLISSPCLCTHSHRTLLGFLVLAHMCSARIARIETSFDTVSCWRQIQHASRASELKLTPNLLKAALRPSSDARLVVYATPSPGTSKHQITHVNSAWVSLMGHCKEEAVGSTLEDLCVGDATDRSVLSRFMHDADRRRPSSMSIAFFLKLQTTCRIPDHSDDR